MKTKSIVAGIVDANGGLRIVVTQPWRIKYHVNKNEQLYIIPRFRVHEPIPLEEASSIIEKVKNHINRVKNK